MRQSGFSSPVLRVDFDPPTGTTTSSSPASHPRIKPSPNTCMAPNCKNIAKPSATAASAPPASTAGFLECRCASRTDAVTVNWFSIEILNAKGKRTYYNRAACGRARWKIENETFNVLKTNGYKLGTTLGTASYPGQRPGHPQPACLRVPHRGLFWRHRLASRRHRAWPDVSLLRASADHHGLRGVPGLARFDAIDCCSRSATTLTKLPHSTLLKHGAERPK